MGEDNPTTAAPKRPRTRRKAVAASLPTGAPAMVAPGPAVAEDGASLEADRVEVRLSGVGRVEARQVAVDRGAVGAVRAGHLSVERGAVGAAMADHVEVSQGYARSILARQVQLDRAGARVIIAADVRAERTAVMFLVARRVSGDMRVLFDWRGALAFGAAAGFVFGLLARVRRKPR